MKKILVLLGFLSVALTPIAAMADPVTPGSLSPITLEGGATMSGFFTFDAGITAISDWNIVLTSSTVNGFTFSADTFTPTSSRVTFTKDFNFGGRLLSIIDVRDNAYPSTNFTHAMTLIFEHIPSVIPATGVALQLCSPTGIVCNDPGFLSINSGEFESNSTASDPFGYAIRNVTSGYFTISDPPAAFNFNLSLNPVLIPVDGGGDTGGGGTTVPEPASLTLFGGGLLGLVFGRKRFSL